MVIPATAVGAPVLVGAASVLVKAIQALYHTAGDFDEYLDHHIADLKGNDNPVIARTGRVMEAVKAGFGVGYLSSTIVIAAGQFLLGNPLSAIGTIVASATLTNPIAMTCAAVGAVYYGWNALSDRERNEIIERLAEGLATGIELIKSVLRFVIEKTREFLSSKNIEEIKKFIAEGAAVFGRTLGDVTHKIADVVSDTFDSVKKKAGTALDTTADAASGAYTAASEAAETLAATVRERLATRNSAPIVDESFVAIEDPDKRLVIRVVRESVVDITRGIPLPPLRDDGPQQR